MGAARQARRAWATTTVNLYFCTQFTDDEADDASLGRGQVRERKRVTGKSRNTSSDDIYSTLNRSIALTLTDDSVDAERNEQRISAV